jgi:hypothetical protein
VLLVAATPPLAACNVLWGIDALRLAEGQGADSGAAGASSPGAGGSAPTQGSSSTGTIGGSSACAPTDDFGDGRLDTHWTAEPGTQASEGGELWLYVDRPGVPSVLRWDCTLDLQTARIEVELASPSTTPNARPFLLLEPVPKANFFEGILIEQRGNVLVFDLVIAGSGINEIVTADSYWRISADSGVILWHTSPNGTDWTVRHSSASPVPVSSLQLVLGLTAEPALAGDGGCAFDDLETTPSGP